MDKKYKVAFNAIKIVVSIIIIIVAIFLAMTYKALFANKTEESQVKTEIEKNRFKKNINIK